MRLWSLHPQYLDAKGLVALWREALLARAVLRGETRGYQHHPQLARFRAHPQPVLALNSYLSHVFNEAKSRGYAFDAGKLDANRQVDSIPVTSGQVEYEWNHLLSKLQTRSPELYQRWSGTDSPRIHPLFRRRAGPRAEWEKVAPR